MKKSISRLISFVLILAVVVCIVVPFSATAADTSALGKLLDSYNSNSSTFKLTSESRFFIASESEPTGDLLQTVQLARKQFADDGYDLDIVWGPATWAAAGDILVILDANCGLTAEGYKLNVADNAMVTAPDVDGLLYGLNTLQKHFRNAGTNIIKGFTAQDVPDTVQRAVSLDCGRKYYTKDWICNFIRQMSWMGYNTIELHFSDDSGFRMDFWDENYYTDNYRPANDFSWICGSNYTSWTLSAYQNDADKGKYLTTAEVIEILETAKEYHIDVIPAFDSPSHLDYMTWKFEQNYKSNTSYSFKSTYKDKTYYAKDVNGCINYTNSTGWSTDLKWPYYAAVNVKGEQAKAFIFELYIDIANFFKEYAGSTDFSIGADEVQLSTSLASGYSYAWGFSDFVNYINELNALLNDKGYTMRMYNDFMGSTAYSASIYDFDDNIEVLYWDSPHNPSSTTASNHTQPVSYYVNEGRILYNCIQTNTYYALRKTSSGSDARSVYNRQWTFYHANEEDIYNEWYSADISEHGDYSEDAADVPAANLGGAYFLIWCDYACISTEAEIWNGCYDTSGSGEYYSLLDRMWSNTIKMWNWDINDSVAFSGYQALRTKFGYFPGFTSCSNADDLSDDVALSQAYLADHSALTAALANKVSGDAYTAESYAAYETAYEAAQTLNADHGASAEEMKNAIAALEAAEAQLELKPVELTVVYQSKVDGITAIIKTEKYTISERSYRLYIAPVTGYTYSSTEGTSFKANSSGDGSGVISGSITANTTVTIWYENTPDASRLDYLVNHAEVQGNYTEASWNAYQAALTAAQNYTASASTCQANIDALVTALEEAQMHLVVESDTTSIISIEKLTETARLGKQVGLKITTTANIRDLTIDGETLTLCVGKVQTLSSGETVKIWLVYFPADVAGEFTYTVHADSASETVDITVQ